MKNHKQVLMTAAALSGAVAIALGAFGAHALSDFLQETGRQSTFETAVSYQFWHTLALFFSASQIRRKKSRGWIPVGYAFLIGIVVFSGSLYLLVFTQTPALGAIAPLGGTALIVGWLLAAYISIRGK
jgi:uncharacterized membrane protein YgdD (TMEM256/DUF423 family)